MKASHFRDLVVHPVLMWLDAHHIHWSQEAEELVIETIYHESEGCEYLRQDPTGPARGVAQVEGPTFQWLMSLITEAPYKYTLYQDLEAEYGHITHDRLAESLALSVIFCRLRYIFATKNPIPTTREGRAQYWGMYYQTDDNKTLEADYIADAKRYIK